jgi:hypothetical protein
MPVIPALRKLKLEDLKFKASLSNTTSVKSAFLGSVRP